MQQLSKGQFYGETHFKRSVSSLTLTDTVYTHDFVDWHYHETPYFTFLLQGGLTEGYKKGRKDFTAGDILFHHWNECHYNHRPTETARGFHLEIDHPFFKEYGLSLQNLQGNYEIRNPLLKILFYRLLAESKSKDLLSEMVIESSVVEIFSVLNNQPMIDEKHTPLWVKRIREILNDHDGASLNLTETAHLLNIHPVHLSRSFKTYFHCTLGEYVRRIRIGKAVSEVLKGNQPLTAIAHDCGFTDQSHFIRMFKTYLGMNPSSYKKLQKQMLI
ncbi:AraC family transcriptional regulator [uncultured Chryseobacterium sp.]|uniref:helix-turn-helix transcriptional regulator n=1 Tax=uncultured Chryseobacterium sp. TaxID=259322 RepID=UPI0025E8F42D|nr:AraC family transcriptional regulator [uncultured Chryseobacterium sp.]